MFRCIGWLVREKPDARAILKATQSMGRGDTWVMRIGMALIVAIASAGLTLWVTGWSLTSPPPKPASALTENLGGKWADINKEFDRRVRTRFPVGTKETTMTGELGRQGFERRDWNYRKLNNEEAVAFRSENSVVCNQGAFVYWRTDQSGNIAAIRGEYLEMGCL